MDDLTNLLSQVLSDPNAMQQIQSVAAALGLGGSPDNAAAGAAPAPQAAPEPQASNPDAGGLDLSALKALINGAGNTPQTPASPPVQNSQPDLSALASLLGGAGGQAAPQPQQGGGLDLSALSGMLGGLMGNSQQSQSGGGDVAALASLLSAGNPPQEPQAPSSPFDMNTLFKLQKAMSSLSANQSNVQLLMALKPRLKPGRAKKVDDAVRVMQLIQFLPLIKETGLFGDMEKLLGGLSGGGGLGNLVGGLGNGISGVLGNLLGGGRR